jgi:hypothetical protein
MSAFTEVLDQALGEIARPAPEVELDGIKNQLIDAHKQAVAEVRDEQYAAEEETAELRAKLAELRDYLKGIEAVPAIGKTLRTLRLAGEVPWV